MRPRSDFKIIYLTFFCNLDKKTVWQRTIILYVVNKSILSLPVQTEIKQHKYKKSTKNSIGIGSTMSDRNINKSGKCNLVSRKSKFLTRRHKRIIKMMASHKTKSQRLLKNCEQRRETKTRSSVACERWKRKY